MNFTLVSAVVVCLPVLILLKENLNRLFVDSRSQVSLSSINLRYLQQHQTEISKKEGDYRSTSEQQPQKRPAIVNAGGTAPPGKKSCIKKSKEPPKDKAEQWFWEKDKSDLTEGGVEPGNLLGTFSLRAPRETVYEILVPVTGFAINMSDEPGSRSSSRPSMSRDMEIALKRVIEATNLLQDGHPSENSRLSNEIEFFSRCSDVINLAPADKGHRKSSDIQSALHQVIDITGSFQAATLDPVIAEGLKKLQKIAEGEDTRV